LVLGRELDITLNLCYMEMAERHCYTDRVGMNDHALQFDSDSFWTRILLLYFTWICTITTTDYHITHCWF